MRQLCTLSHHLILNLTSAGILINKLESLYMDPWQSRKIHICVLLNLPPNNSKTISQVKFWSSRTNRRGGEKIWPKMSLEIIRKDLSHCDGNWSWGIGQRVDRPCWLHQQWTLDGLNWWQLHLISGSNNWSEGDCREPFAGPEFWTMLNCSHRHSPRVKTLTA